MPINKHKLRLRHQINNNFLFHSNGFHGAHHCVHMWNNITVDGLRVNEITRAHRPSFSLRVDESKYGLFCRAPNQRNERFSKRMWDFVSLSAVTFCGRENRKSTLYHRRIYSWIYIFYWMPHRPASHFPFSFYFHLKRLRFFFFLFILSSSVKLKKNKIVQRKRYVGRCVACHAMRSALVSQTMWWCI